MLLEPPKNRPAPVLRAVHPTGDRSRGPSPRPSCRSAAAADTALVPRAAPAAAGREAGRPTGGPFRPVARRVASLLASVVASLVVGMLAAGCGGPPPAADRPLRVVATTTIVADLVRQVAGDRVEVECLMAAGIDPHSYKATSQDAERLLGAGLIVASGLHLEGRLADLLEQLGDRVPLLAVADRLPAARLLDAGAGIPDPHVWFDAELWSLTPEPVADALAALDPAGAAGYRERAAAYAMRLRRLDAAVRERLATIPPAGRVLVTAHDAFRYFGRAYGVEVVGVQGTNTTSEAGLGDVNRLVTLVVERKIPAVFVETSVADRNVAAVVEGAAARGHAVRLGGRLYSDSLGPAGGGDDTLEGALTANVEAIVAGLVPARDEPQASP